MTILTDINDIPLIDDTEDAALLVLEDVEFEIDNMILELLVEGGELTARWEDLDLLIELLVEGGELSSPVPFEDIATVIELVVEGGNLTTGMDYIYYTAELVQPEASIEALIPTGEAELLQPTIEIDYFIHKKTEDD